MYIYSRTLCLGWLLFFCCFFNCALEFCCSLALASSFSDGDGKSEGQQAIINIINKMTYPIKLKHYQLSNHK